MRACETPEKVVYLTLRDAARAAVEMLALYGPSRPYGDCTCGRYHLTTKGMNGNDLTAKMVTDLAEALGV